MNAKELIALAEEWKAGTLGHAGIDQVFEYVLQHIKEDDDEPITEEWLESSGWDQRELFYSRLIEPVNSSAAIIEVTVCPDDSRFVIHLEQGLPHGDDQKLREDIVLLTGKEYKTRGQLRNLLTALGVNQ